MTTMITVIVINDKLIKSDSYFAQCLEFNISVEAKSLEEIPEKFVVEFFCKTAAKDISNPTPQLWWDFWQNFCLYKEHICTKQVKFRKGRCYDALFFLFPFLTIEGIDSINDNDKRIIIKKSPRLERFDTLIPVSNYQVEPKPFRYCKPDNIWNGIVIYEGMNPVRIEFYKHHVTNKNIDIGLSEQIGPCFKPVFIHHQGNEHYSAFIEPEHHCEYPFRMSNPPAEKKQSELAKNTCQLKDNTMPKHRIVTIKAIDGEIRDLTRLVEDKLSELEKEGWMCCGTLCINTTMVQLVMVKPDVDERSAIIRFLSWMLDGIEISLGSKGLNLTRVSLETQKELLRFAIKEISQGNHYDLSKVSSARLRNTDSSPTT
jgi:hypothetical protein